MNTHPINKILPSTCGSLMARAPFRKDDTLEFTFYRAGTQWAVKTERGTQLFDQPGGRRAAYLRGAAIVHGAEPFVDRLLQPEGGA